MEHTSQFDLSRFPSLAKGTISVTVRDIPYLLAEAVYPPKSEGNKPWLLIHCLMKRRLDQVDVQQPLGQLEPLDEDDWKVLRSIWKALPNYHDGLEEEEWLPYEHAFDKADPWPNYELCPMWDNQDSLREQACRNYTGWLHKAIADGLIITRTANNVPLFNPTGEMLLSAEVSVSDLKRLLTMLDASSDRGYKSDSNTLAINDGQHHFPPDSWEAQAYQIAKRWQAEQRRQGFNPGQEDIANEVAKYMKANKLFGKHKGKTPSAGTIRKEVLIGRLTKETG